MKTLKLTIPLLKKENCFTYGQIRQKKQAADDPTVIIATTVTHIGPRR